MTDQQIAKKVCELIVPIYQKLDYANEDSIDMLEYQLDFILEGLTENQEQLLDEMLEENGII